MPYFCLMKHLILLCLIIFFSHFLIGQTVYEKILIPVSIFPKSEESNLMYKAEIDKLVKKNKIKSYIVGTIYDLHIEGCENNIIGNLLEKSIKDSLKWVSILKSESNGYTFTLSTGSKSKAYIVEEKISNLSGLMKFTSIHTLLPIDKDTSFYQPNDPSYTYYLQITIKADKNQTKNLLFQTFKEGIYFKGHSDVQEDNCLFFTDPLMIENQAYEAYKKMAQNVQYIGKAMNAQNDNQNKKIEKECKYKGEMVFDAMEKTTVEDIKMFLNHVLDNCIIYRREMLSLPEIYASWLVRGMPLPKK